MRYFLIIFLACITSICYAALSPIEQQIQQSVIGLQPSQIDLLKTIVNINSGTSNLSGVKRVGEIIRPVFDKLGFKTYWVYEPESFQRAPTLIAEHPNVNAKQRLLLIGHLDTVFTQHSKFQTFDNEKKYIHGPGVVDDKGGVVVMLSALQALHQTRQLKDLAITVVLTGDEEESGKPAFISRKPLIEAAKRSDIALDFEEALSLDTASIARRGISTWRISVKGKEAHSSAIFTKEIGAGAIFELARILNTMRTDIHTAKSITYNPGLILGGTVADYNPQQSGGNVFGKANVIAKTAFAKGDFRYLSIEEKTKIENQMKQIVQAHLPGTISDIHFTDGIPAMSPTEANIALLKKYSGVSEDLGQGKIHILPPEDRGAGDISYIANFMPANLVGLGPMGYDTHSVAEKLYTKSLLIQTQRAAILMHRLG